MKRLRLLIGILCVFLCVSVLFACSTQASPTPEPPNVSDSSDENEPPSNPSDETAPPSETDTDNTPTEPTPPIHIHSLTFVAHENATCTTAGNIAYWKCSSCPKTFADESGTQELTDITIGKRGHDFAITFTIDKEPSCTEVGSKSRHCSRCNAVTDITEIPIAHSLSHVEANVATCTATGNIEHWKCTKCPKMFADALGTQEISDVVIDKTAHTIDNGMCTTCSHQDKSVSRFIYELNTEEDGYIITGLEWLADNKILIIPAKYKQLPVKQINYDAFSTNTDIVALMFEQDCTWTLRAKPNTPTINDKKLRYIANTKYTGKNLHYITNQTNETGYKNRYWILVE